MSLWWDLYRLQEDLEDSQNRLECLVECHLEENPSGLLPDFVFPLQKVLQQALEEIQILRQELQVRVRPEVQQAIQVLMEDPQAQVLMERLAQAEELERAQAAVSELVRVEESVEVLEPGQVQE